MPNDSDVALQKARAAKPLAEKVFAGLLGDVAVGITRVGGVYGLKVNLTSAPPPALNLPATVGGVPVCIEVTGPIKKRSDTTKL